MLGAACRRSNGYRRATRQVRNNGGINARVIAWRHRIAGGVGHGNVHNIIRHGVPANDKAINKANIVTSIGVSNNKQHQTFIIIWTHRRIAAMVKAGR